MGDSNGIFRVASIWCLSFSIVTLAFIEVGLSSWLVEWGPTYETSIALSVLSIAFRVIALDIDLND